MILEKNVRDKLGFGFFEQVQIFFLSIEIVAIKESFLIIWKKQPSRIVQMLCKKVFLGIAVLHLWIKKDLRVTVKMFILVQL